MVKAIKVTTKNKADNPEFFKGNVVGTIYQKSLPINYNGVEILNAGGYETRTDLHLLDGFKDIVQPPINLLTEKRGSELIDHPTDATKYTYAVIPFTQAEIDANLTASLESQDELNEQANEDEGLKLIRRCRKRLRRRIDDGRLDAAKGRQLRRWFSQLFFHLRNGDWDLAQEDILKTSFPIIPFPTDNDLVREINWFKDRLNDYITTNYQKP